MTARISRSAHSYRKRNRAGKCRDCGVKPRAVDPRYSRDLEIRKMLGRGVPPEIIAFHFEVSLRHIHRISKKPKGKAKLLTRCEQCRILHNSREANTRGEK